MWFLRMVLTLGMTLLFKYLALELVYGLFTAATLGATLLCFVLERRAGA